VVISVLPGKTGGKYGETLPTPEKIDTYTIKSLDVIYNQLELFYTSSKLI
jgi:hypothetical protein